MKMDDCKKKKSTVESNCFCFEFLCQSDESKQFSTNEIFECDVEIILILERSKE